MVGSFGWARKIALLTLVCCMAPFTAKPDDGAPVKIEIGLGGIVPTARQWYIDEAMAFDKARPDIEVTIVDDGKDTRPATRIKDVPNIARNVIGIQAPINAEVYYLVAREMIVPIEKFLPDPGFNRDAFYDNAFNTVTVDGKTWGVPWFLDGLWMLCDWELFEAEGITEPPKTWTEFMQVAKRMTKDTNGDGKVDQWGVRFPAVNTGLLATVLMTRGLQNHAQMHDGKQVVLRDAKLVENFEFMRDLLRSGYVKMDPTNTFAGAPGTKERCAMQFMFNSSQYSGWPAEAARNAYENRKLRCAFVPTDGDQTAIVGERYYLCIRKATPAEEKASWEFVKWINRPDAKFPAFWFGYPCRKDVIDRPEFKEWAAKTCQNVEIAVASTAWSRDPSLLFDSQMYAVAFPYLTRILTGQVEVAPELEKLEAELNKLLITRPEKVNPQKLLE